MPARSLGHNDNNVPNPGDHVLAHLSREARF